MAGCGHGHCEHDHNHIGEEKGFEYSLYKKIDFTHLEVLNESEEDSGKAVFKSWEERLDTNKVRPETSKSACGFFSLFIIFNI